MPGQVRIDAPGALHQIIARGIARGKIFRDDQDRDYFVTRPGALIVQTQARRLAWVMIPYHFNRLLKTGTESIAGFMRHLLTSVAVTLLGLFKKTNHCKARALCCYRSDEGLVLSDALNIRI